MARVITWHQCKSLIKANITKEPTMSSGFFCKSLAFPSAGEPRWPMTELRRDCAELIM